MRKPAPGVPPCPWAAEARRHAECNFVIADAETGAIVERQHEADVDNSREIRLSEWRRRFFLHRAFDGGARWLAPLL